jgi:hypothetical protein
MTTHTVQRRELPRPAARGIASGIFFLTFFGAFWGFISAAFMSGTFQIVAFILVGLVTLAFFGLGIMILRYARSLPKTLSPEDAAVGKKISLWFGIVFGLEMILIALANIVLSYFQVRSFIAPVTALIVGIHFLPLARLFRVSVYYITGALLSLLALIALAALLLGLPIGGPSPYNWSLLVGIGTTLVLWLTLLNSARLGLRAMRQGR